jgi:hypothetical protein
MFSVLKSYTQLAILCMLDVGLPGPCWQWLTLQDLLSLECFSLEYLKTVRLLVSRIICWSIH